MIRAEGICKSFDRQQVLTDVSFEVNDCSVYGLIGYNGAGSRHDANSLCEFMKQSVPYRAVRHTSLAQASS